jgi:hypothetical protein
VEIGEDIIEVLRVEVGIRRHEAVAMQYGCGHAIIVGGSAAGQVLLLEDAEQRWAMQGAGGAVIVALSTASLEDDVAVRLLGV